MRRIFQTSSTTYKRYAAYCLDMLNSPVSCFLSLKFLNQQFETNIARESKQNDSFILLCHFLSFTAQTQNHLPPQGASLSSFHDMPALFGASGGCMMKWNASPVQYKMCSRQHCMSTHPLVVVVIAAAFSHLEVDQSWLYEKWASYFTL